MTADPLLDPVPPTHAELPSPGLRRNRAFMLLWSAATVSIFGSFVTRIALPFVAIETLSAGPIQIAALRAVDLLAALAEEVGLRWAAFLGPLCALVGALGWYRSPVWRVRRVDAARR